MSLRDEINKLVKKWNSLRNDQSLFKYLANVLLAGFLLRFSDMNEYIGLLSKIKANWFLQI